MRYIRGEIYFPVIIGLHFILWMVDLSRLEGPPILVMGESPVQRVFGEVMSSWVVTVFGFNLLMATRARWVERIFGGLDKMYVIHRRSGIVAAVLLLLHFGTVPRYPEFSIGKPMGFAAMALILLGIAFAASPLVKRKLPYHKWIGGHRLMGAFYVVGVCHALFVPTLISKLPLIRAYVFGMASLGCASWVYRAFLFRRLHPPLSYVVTEVRRFQRSAVEICMTPENQLLEHEAGQFAFFSFGELSPEESHPFTIASAPTDDALRIVVKASGDFTSQLVGSVKSSDTVQVEGPCGHLTQSNTRSDEQIWVAGGIGVTPFLALARSLVGTGKKAKLLWTVRSGEDAYYDNELRALAQDSEFEYELWKSNERGRLSVDAAGGLSTFQGKDVIICGPAALRDGLTAQLRKLGTKRGQIHSEEFAFR